MRTAPSPIPPIAWAGLILGAGIASGLVGLFAGLWGALAVLVLAALTVAILAWRSATRWRARRAALATPFPEAWRSVLRQWCDHYNRLPDKLRARFEDDLRIFTVILSVPALCQSFRDPDDAYHVGFHEFAHLLDLEQTHFDGIPLGFDDVAARRWVEIREREIPPMLRGESLLDEYGAHDPVEFLAVAVEAFFETALAMRRNHAELYELLMAYFRQDPAAWDDARGLTLEPRPRPRLPRRKTGAGRRRPRSRLSA
jgi:Mlc titration factor MtfA (ptsG expression regulator)